MVAVDSSVIIHLAKIGRLNLLEKLFKKIKITEGIKEEILHEGKQGIEEIRKALETCVEVSESTSKGRLNTQKAENNTKFSAFLSNNDISLVLLAEKHRDVILTNDAEIVLTAKAKGIKVMWFTAFIMICIKKKIISKHEGKKVFFDLIESGMYLNTEVYAALLKQIDEM